MEKQIEFQTTTITPKDAMLILEKNINNRKLNKKKVENYVRDLKSDNWITTSGETIKFDLKGNLIDGQHRLQAIIDADKTAIMYAAYNCHPDAQKVIDLGNRTLHEMFKLKDVKNSRRVASLVRTYLSICGGKSINQSFTSFNANTKFFFGKFTPTIPECNAFYDNNKEQIEKVMTLYAPIIYSKERIEIISPTMLLVFSYILMQYKVDYEKINNFLQQLVLGIGSTNKAILDTRKILFRKKKQRENEPSVVLWERIFRTWNCFIINSTDSYKILNEIPEIILR